MTSDEASVETQLPVLDTVEVDELVSSAHVMTVLLELPPGSPGTPPHRHSGPVFGYLVEGEMLFELEDELPRVIRAGEAFSEPGGDRIHYQAANNIPDGWTRFVATMVCLPGQPMLTLVPEEELEERAHRRRGHASSGDRGPATRHDSSRT